MKFCYKCQTIKVESEFGRNKSRSDGLADQCRSCTVAGNLEYRRRNALTISKRRKELYQANPQPHKDRAVAFQKANPNKVKVYSKRASTAIRTEAMSHYSLGDIACSRCGESDRTVLTIDHVEGGGNRHRKETKCGKGPTFCFWLKRNGFPPGFQVLCWNCQFRKRHEEMQPRLPLTLRQEQKKAYVRSVKLGALSHYGTVCPCGVDDIAVLTLDHVNDDGASHRKSVGKRGFNFYVHLRVEGYPNDPPLQVVCMNCQYRKRVTSRAVVILGDPEILCPSSVDSVP